MCICSPENVSSTLSFELNWQHISSEETDKIWHTIWNMVGVCRGHTDKWGVTKVRERKDLACWIWWRNVFAGLSWMVRRLWQKLGGVRQPGATYSHAWLHWAGLSSYARHKSVWHQTCVLYKAAIKCQNTAILDCNVNVLSPGINVTLRFGIIKT